MKLILVGNLGNVTLGQIKTFPSQSQAQRNIHKFLTTFAISGVQRDV